MTREASGRDNNNERVRFADLLRRFGLESYVDRVFRLVADQYSEPGRYYHTLAHINFCLAQLDQVRGLLHDPDAVELALWFHDIVYDPAANDNELRSALLFDSELGVHLPTDRANKVHAMIMATVHPSNAARSDAQYVADIDLSSLALPRDEFLRDTESLRRECRHLTDSQFQLGTLGFFKKLMARPSIYLTEHFRKNIGTRARRNIVELTTEMENDSREITLRLQRPVS